ncbi:MAG: DUF1549 domain-containing protein [Planctomycetota bacterium]
MAAFLSCATFVSALGAAAAASEPSAAAHAPLRALRQDGADEAERLFEEFVRPTFEAKCSKCHGAAAKRVKGGLRMTGRDALLEGGFSGPSIDLEDPTASLLVRAVRYEAVGQEMPPDERLEAEVVDAIQRWVELGAPWPQAPLREPTPEEREAAAFFEREVRPILALNCFECHGPNVEEPKGHLRMASREHLAAGGSRGPAIVPGDVEASLLVHAVRYDPATINMPPTGPLSKAKVAVLEKWIAMGAPWPDGEVFVPVSEEDELKLVSTARERWPYVPLERPAVPEVAGAPTEIDAFVRATLAAKGIEPNPLAEPRELVERLHFDLTGLPPSIEVVDAFVADPSPEAYAKLVDDLLASPAFGEHWARMWLDVVRYAQTNGFEDDREKPYAWRYRDYVVRSFDQDVPYDRFVLEQIAGDELFPDDVDAAIATGVYRLGTFDRQTDDELQAQFDDYDDVVRTFSEGFLGLTVGCARCHDHKYDPIPQEDYYGILGFIRNVEPYAEERFNPDSSTLGLFGPPVSKRNEWKDAMYVRQRKLRVRERDLLAAARDRFARDLLADAPEAAREAYATPLGRRTNAQRRALSPYVADLGNVQKLRGYMSAFEAREYQRIYVEIEQIEKEESFEGDFDWYLTVREDTGTILPTEVFARGDPTSPTATVEPHFPLVLNRSDAAAYPEMPQGRPYPNSSGRRAILARWIASPDNPMTARVMSNRLWKGMFGKGLVQTPNDFGLGGVSTSDPQLLDWLASEFVAGGWSVKSLLRRIALSETYRASSRPLSPTGLELDPNDDLFWRQGLRRLSAEQLRDSMLAVSGELQTSRGGRGFFPELDREVLAGASRPGEGWEPSSYDERCRRAIYGYVKRGMQDPLAVAFDAADPTSPVGARAVTTTPIQALSLVNGRFSDQRARMVAYRAARTVGDSTEERVTEVFRSVLQRVPTDEELAACVALVEDLTVELAATPSVVVLEPGVPDRLSDIYLETLAEEDTFVAPTDGMVAVRGSFGNPYNATVELDVDRGPARLVRSGAIDAGGISATFRPHEGATVFALIFGASAKEHVFTGLEAHLDLVEGTVELRRHDPDPDAAPTVLASATFEPAFDRETRVDVEFGDGKAGVRIDGRSVLVADGLGAATKGLVGLRSWGDAVDVANFEVLTPGADAPFFSLDTSRRTSPQVDALSAVALVLLNSNEFVHVP